uniref:Uncharacterized protein n=1 Tax=Rhizophora mucronata TaxID=61149 RepID=A0A2P2P5G2_RHIMU
MPQQDKIWEHQSIHRTTKDERIGENILFSN